MHTLLGNELLSQGEALVEHGSDWGISTFLVA